MLSTCGVAIQVCRCHNCCWIICDIYYEAVKEFDFSTFIQLWPAYIDSDISIADGRRLSKESCCKYTCDDIGVSHRFRHRPRAYNTRNVRNMSELKIASCRGGGWGLLWVLVSFLFLFSNCSLIRDIPDCSSDKEDSEWDSQIQMAHSAMKIFKQVWIFHDLFFWCCGIDCGWCD